MWEARNGPCLSGTSQRVRQEQRPPHTAGLPVPHHNLLCRVQHDQAGSRSPVPRLGASVVGFDGVGQGEG